VAQTDELSDAYIEAWRDWLGSEDAAWECTTADGLD
jgi:hypothetical protein